MIPDAALRAALESRLQVLESALAIQNEVISRLRGDLDRLEELAGELQVALFNAVAIARGEQ